MTDHDLLALRWNAAMARMCALNIEQQRRQVIPWRLREMRLVAESRLDDFFAHVERVMRPIPDTPGDRKRRIAA